MCIGHYDVKHDLHSRSNVQLTFYLPTLWTCSHTPFKMSFMIVQEDGASWLQELQSKIESEKDIPEESEASAAAKASKKERQRGKRCASCQALPFGCYEVVRLCEA